MKSRLILVANRRVLGGFGMQPGLDSARPKPRDDIPGQEVLRLFLKMRVSYHDF